MGAATAGLLLCLGSLPRLSISAMPERGLRWGRLAARRGQRWQGPAETRRKHELSAAECRGQPRRRGAEGLRGRAPAPSLCTAPSPPTGPSPMGTRYGPAGGPQGWRKAVLPPSMGPGAPLHNTDVMGPAALAKPLQQLHPSLVRNRGAASPPAPWPGGAPLLPCLGQGLCWDGQERAAFFLPLGHPVAGMVPWERVEGLPGSTKLGVGASPLCASTRFLP